MKKFRILLPLLLSLGLSAFAQVPKKILVEKITSAGCPSCPGGDLILEDLLAADTNLIPVALHVNDQWHKDKMANPVGDDVLDEYYWATPSLMVDRVFFQGNNHVALLSSQWGNHIAIRKNDPVEVTLGGTSTYDAMSRNLTVQVEGTFLGFQQADFRVNAYVVEDSVWGSGLGWDQLNGNNNTPGHPLNGLGDPIPSYVHNWVLRDMLGGAWGADGIIPGTVWNGTDFTHTFQTSLDTAWNPAKCSVVILVQKFDTSKFNREVLNAARLGLNDDLAMSNATARPELYFQAGPNPAREQVTFSGEGSGELQILDLQGRLIHKVQLQNQGPTFKYTWDGRDAQGNLVPAGIYLCRFRNGDRAASLKLLWGVTL